LPKWLNGENLNINEFCTEEYDKMKEIDETVYTETPMPFKSQF
jgi:hypothetical protein